MEKIVLKYEADELPTFKRDVTKDEYEGRIRRIRAAFATMRYPKTEAPGGHPKCSTYGHPNCSTRPGVT